ncbi:MCE family protein [Mycolicibacterium moriokaense]|uniref:Phospholipid/cholesterol/gamma-HCH transport system substrate-binding protein n=1 Tax=Mycolicibacterium moriokaense TaxID=39691 RepID=A0A318H748_9MYCO|nr:MCE family protein [Mycolicibacterium moriokaense]PXX00366.1 phospholipid/cholesterol/gamma-HCH transport system substrate-binding protein [Mycolicibacterium moriokaense]
MKRNLPSVAVRLGLFTTVCAAGTFALIMVFAQLRFAPTTTYNATFASVTGLTDGQFVRVAGVEVGKVDHIVVNDDGTATVTFRADRSVLMTEGTRAVIRYDNLIGDRYLELQEGAGGVRPLKPGDTIPVQRTAPALDLDELIGGFRPLFRALNPDQVNALSSQLIQVFQNQGTTINSFLAQTAQLTSALADRDELIGQVITNLNTVLGSLSEQSKNFDQAVTSLSELVEGLAARKTDISNSVAYTNAAAASVSDLLRLLRPPLANTIAQSDRADSIVAADHEYVDNLLATLPDTYKALARLGLYGDFFSYYVCDLMLKVNGKGGQPVYVKLAGQDSGRCSPK